MRPSSTRFRPFSPFTLAALTALAMGVATFGQSMFGVLASDLIAEFGIERWQIGALVTASGLTGAAVSPFFGRVTDSVGGVKSVRGVLALGAVAMSVVALSPTYAALFIGAMLGGVPNGWTNPATNALIVDNVAVGSRGVITGAKQSGVQMGAFLGGLLIPVMASLTDWRIAFAAFLVFPVAGLVGMIRRPQVVRKHTRDSSGRRAQLPGVVRWLALYGTLTGFGVSSVLTFLPLFAQETQGWTSAQAGLLIAGIGLVGVVARISWGSISERRLGHGRTLRRLAVLSSASTVLLALASAGLAGGWVLIPAALLVGTGAVAWNAVGMLAVMDYSTPALVGRGTGIIMLGFLTGIGLGPPLMGLSVDRLGTYTPGWLALTALFAATTMVAAGVQRTGTLASS